MKTSRNRLLRFIVFMFGLILILAGGYHFVGHPKCDPVSPVDGLENPVLVDALADTLRLQHGAAQCGQSITIGLIIRENEPINTDTIPLLDNDRQRVIFVQDRPEETSKTALLPVHMDMIHLLRRIAPNATLYVYVSWPAERGGDGNIVADLEAGANRLIHSYDARLILNAIAHPLMLTAENQTRMKSLLTAYPAIVWLHTAGGYRHANHHVQGQLTPDKDSEDFVVNFDAQSEFVSEESSLYFIPEKPTDADAADWDERRIELLIDFETTPNIDLVCERALGEGAFAVAWAALPNHCSLLGGAVWPTEPQSFKLTVNLVRMMRLPFTYHLIIPDASFEDTSQRFDTREASFNLYDLPNSARVSNLSTIQAPGIWTGFRPDLLVTGIALPDSLYGLAYVGGAVALIVGKTSSDTGMTDDATALMQLLKRLRGHDGGFALPQPQDTQAFIDIIVTLCLMIVVWGVVAATEQRWLWIRWLMGVVCGVVLTVYVVRRLTDEDINLVLVGLFSIFVGISGIGIARLFGFILTQEDFENIKKGTPPRVILDFLLPKANTNQESSQDRE